MSQTVNGVTTNYVLDLASPLTQVLSDGTNTYVYGVDRIAQMNGGIPEYFLTDGLGSVRQLVDSNGSVTLAKSYQPYGTEISSVGSGLSSYGFAGEATDSTGLTYLRARYYSSGMGRFLTRDTWREDYYSPLTLNAWNYTSSNPVNYTDPTGQRAWCAWWWNQWAVKQRVDVAEEYVTQTSDPIDTYTAGGIAIQCAGTNFNKDWFGSGSGLAQISINEANTEWSQPIYDSEPKKDANGNPVIKNGKPVFEIRTYGLRLRCLDGELEKALNPNNTKDAVALMKRRIQLVISACPNCTDTDKYVAAALSQNGSGFSYGDMQELTDITPKIKKNYGIPTARINKDWLTYFERDADDHNMVNTKTQLNWFILVVNELQTRRWVVPDIDSIVINKLKNWKE